MTATDANGSLSDTSPPTQPIADIDTPVISAAPAVSGVTQQGQTLSATTGRWTGPVVTGYTYQWQDCDQNGENCVDIDGATASMYVLAAGDVDSTVRVVVTATGGSGATQAAATVVGPIDGPYLTNVSVPMVSGTAALGDELSATSGA